MEITDLQIRHLEVGALLRRILFIGGSSAGTLVAAEMSCNLIVVRVTH